MTTRAEGQIYLPVMWRWIESLYLDTFEGLCLAVLLVGAFAAVIVGAARNLASLF